MPNLPIELGDKTILIDVTVMTGPVDYKILLGHDYIYAMNVVVSSLFWVMKLPHEGRIVTIDHLAYCDPPPCPTPNTISPYVVLLTLSQ